MRAIEHHLSVSAGSAAGPFVLGIAITYADLVVYQICHDERLTVEACVGLSEFSRLKTLCQVVEQRPNVKRFLQSARYLG